MKLPNPSKLFINKKVILLPALGLLLATLSAAGYIQYKTSQRNRPMPSTDTGEISQEVASELEKQEIPADADPESKAAHYLLIADFYFAEKQYEKATIYYEKAVESQPSDSYILEKAGDAYKQLANIAKANEYYRRAIEETKTSSDPSNDLILAQLYEKSGNNPEAIKYYQSAIDRIESSQESLSEEDKELLKGLRDKLKNLRAGA